jgi:hypothetical protein
MTLCLWFAEHWALSWGLYHRVWALFLGTWRRLYTHPKWRHSLHTIRTKAWPRGRLLFVISRSKIYCGDIEAYCERDWGECSTYRGCYQTQFCKCHVVGRTSCRTGSSVLRSFMTPTYAPWYAPTCCGTQHHQGALHKDLKPTYIIDYKSKSYYVTQFVQVMETMWVSKTVIIYFWP